MGVIFEYFRAADLDTSRARLTSVLHGTPEPAVDAIDTKRYDPSVVMGQLMALALNRPWSPDLVSEKVIWPEDPPPATEQELADLPEDSPWNSGIILTELSASFRDALADVDDSALPRIAHQWRRIEELDGSEDFDSALAFIEDFVSFTRRAKQAGDLLYCLMIA